jgi:hypothetical protein
MTARDAGTDDDLVDALRRRDRRQWNESALGEYLRDAEAVKREAALCADCAAPCETGELCVSVVADELGLLEGLGRRQATDAVESAAKKLALRGEVSVRREGDYRPNTFVEPADGG